ncbi:MAG: hypothetical protein WB809_01520 [Thermoplasmata archaeon]
MSPRRRNWLVLAGILAAVGIVISLVILFSPLPGGSSGEELVNGKLYSFESESIFGGAAWLNYSYRGVTFGFHLWCLVTPAFGEVCGNATEPSGVSYAYAFSDGPPEFHVTWQTWVAPDAHEAVEYRQGGTIHLLVAE